jgi:hypothetical protein
LVGAALDDRDVGEPGEGAIAALTSPVLSVVINGSPSICMRAD